MTSLLASWMLNNVRYAVNTGGRMPQHPDPEPRRSVISHQIGDAVSVVGWPRMAGRVIGLLLVADPPYLSTSDLCDQLPASKAHVSGVLQLLSSLRLVQRFGVSGSRQAHYRLAPNAWLATTRANFANLDDMVRIADDAVAFAAPGSVAAEQLGQMRDFYRFMATRLPQLLDEYEAQT